MFSKYQILFCFSCVLKFQFLTNCAPLDITSLLDDFIAAFDIEHCEFPEQIVFPDVSKGSVQTTVLSDEEVTHIIDFSIPLAVCAVKVSPDQNRDKKICIEIFKVLTNISTCSLNSTVLGKIGGSINIAYDNDVCDEFRKHKHIFPVTTGFISYKLTEQDICNFICDGHEIREACQFLLWAYRVQAAIYGQLKDSNSSNFGILPPEQKDDHRLTENGASKIKNPSLPSDEGIPVIQHNSLVENPVGDSKQSNIGDPTKPNVAVGVGIKSSKSTIPNVKKKDSVTKSPSQDAEKQGDPVKTANALPVDTVTQTGILHKDDPYFVKDKPKEIGDIANSLQKNKDTKELTNKNENINNSTTNQGEPQNEGIQPLNPQDASPQNSLTRGNPVKNDNVSEEHKSVNVNEIPDTSKNVTKASKSANSDGMKKSGPASKPESTTPGKKNASNLETELQSIEGKNGKSIQEPKFPEASEMSDTPNLPEFGEQSDSKEKSVKPVENDNKGGTIGAMLETMEGGDASDVGDENGDSTFENYTPKHEDDDMADNSQQILKNHNSNSKVPENSLTDDEEQTVQSEGLVNSMPGDDLDDGRSMNGGGGKPFSEPEDTHFFFYFISIITIIIGSYLLFHNKQKIIALIIEGRHERKRRSHSVNYKKLDTK